MFNFINRNKDTLTVIFTVIITVSEFYASSLTKISDEKYLFYISKRIELSEALAEINWAQGNLNLQMANWLNCLNLNEYKKCEPLHEFMNIEKDNKSQSFIRLTKKGEGVNLTGEEYLLAQESTLKYGRIVNLVVYIFATSILLLNSGILSRLKMVQSKK